jgi:hypothetical protein
LAGFSRIIYRRERKGRGGSAGLVFLKRAAFKVNFAATTFLRPQGIFNALLLSRPV